MAFGSKHPNFYRIIFWCGMIFEDSEEEKILQKSALCDTTKATPNHKKKDDKNIIGTNVCNHKKRQ